MPKSFMPAAIAVATLVLGGCAAHAHRLVAGDTVAQLRHAGGGEANRLIVERDGRRYEGEFRLERVRDAAALQRRFASEPRRLERISAGLEIGHVLNLARVELRSTAGDRLSCELSWPDGGRHGGACSGGDGPDFRLLFD